jgi:hypothetical protein
MVITVEAIKFNHDPAGHTTDALNIRRNAATFVNVPEWRRGVTTTPEQSPAAYAKRETAGNTITIQASFRSDEPGVTAQIRAIDPDKNPPRNEGGGCGGFIVWLIRRFLWAVLGNVLGEVVEKWATFNAAGGSGYVTFDLRDLRLPDVGVGPHITTWQWQYRLQAGAPWINIDVTTHKTYVLLEVPKSPWQQAPYNAGNTQLPWTDVLDYACIWAIGASDVDAAAGKVTAGVYRLGSSLVTYDCPGGGSTHYTDYSSAFYCTEFVERLGGGLGLGQYVNCTDCATFVTTFANILGCDLSEMTLGWMFALNEMIAIGSTSFSLPCAHPPDDAGWPSFRYHEVGWKGPCSNDGYVFDGCLKVDGDADPSGGPPHVPLLAVNMRHGATGDLLYRDRLAAPGGRPNCSPDCGNVRRRTVA